jgi:hypothetical protein
MFPPLEDKGKIFTDVVRKEPVEVILQTSTNLIIKGTLHVRLNSRLKDEIDSSERFVAITDATVLDAQGETIHRAKFLSINRSHIVWLFPINDRAEPGSEE